MLPSRLLIKCLILSCLIPAIDSSQSRAEPKQPENSDERSAEHLLEKNENANPDREVAKPNDSIEGTWTVLKLAQNGQSLTFDDQMRYRFLDGRVKVQVKGQPSADLRFTIDTSHSPDRLDMVLRTDGGDQTSPMIFKVRDDELWIAYSPPGKPRPTTFVAAPGTHNTVIRMRRLSASSKQLKANR